MKVRSIQTRLWRQLETLANELQLPSDSIVLERNGMELSDPTRTLMSMGITSNDESVSTRRIDLKLSVGADKERANYRMPDEIDVVVTFDDDRPAKRITVGISKSAARKPYLGGFRHKKTGVVYHHAGTQSVLSGDGKKKEVKQVEKFHRDCQTVFESTRSLAVLERIWDANGALGLVH